MVGKCSIAATAGCIDSVIWLDRLGRLGKDQDICGSPEEGPRLRQGLECWLVRLCLLQQQLEESS